MAEPLNFEKHPHLRLNQLTGEWIVVSPHRTNRPWLGDIEPIDEIDQPRFDSTNPLCPGVQRSSGKVTDQYLSTYAFENDFPALLELTPEPVQDEDELLQCKTALGKCFVMCFHPYSNLSLPLMTLTEIQAVISEWIKQFDELKKKYKWIQIFENKGKMMGCSNSHPHCQIYACSFLPTEAIKEDTHQLEYYNKKGTSLLLDYAKVELKKKVRVVAENEFWLVLVPYWALWPFELLVLPKHAVQRLSDLSQEQQQSLASTMKCYLTKYDNLFKTSFPYSMGWHGAPSGEDCGKDFPHWQLHAHYYPPLLRSATIKKHLVGFEMFASGVRDITPEKAASMLCACSDVHYKKIECCPVNKKDSLLVQ